MIVGDLKASLKPRTAEPVVVVVAPQINFVVLPVTLPIAYIIFIIISLYLIVNEYTLTDDSDHGTWAMIKNRNKVPKVEMRNDQGQTRTGGVRGLGDRRRRCLADIFHIFSKKIFTINFPYKRL